LDEHYGIRVCDANPVDDNSENSENLSVNFDSRLINDFLTEWQQRKKDLADGVISKAEYMEWKLNWPQSAGERPTKQWRKPPGGSKRKKCRHLSQREVPVIEY
jgi:hypothetical protein